MLELDEHCAEELVPPPLPLPERFDLEAMFDTHNGAVPGRFCFLLIWQFDDQGRD